MPLNLKLGFWGMVILLFCMGVISYRSYLTRSIIPAIVDTDAKVELVTPAPTQASDPAKESTLALPPRLILDSVKVTNVNGQETSVLLGPRFTSINGAELMGFWNEFGIAGDLFPGNDQPKGTVNLWLESLAEVKTFSGEVWYIHFDPSGDHKPLGTRRIYMVLLSGDQARGCGNYIEHLQSNCIVLEKVLTWEETQDFFREKISNPNDEFEKLRKFAEAKSP